MKRLIITAIILFGIVAVCQASMTMRMDMRMGGGVTSVGTFRFLTEAGANITTEAGNIISRE